MANNYFWADDEMKMIQDPQTRLFDNQKAYKESLTGFLLSGLKNLGYQEAFKLLEKESGVQLPKVIDDELKQYVRQHNFDAAIGYINLTERQSAYSENNRQTLLYELLKLKFVQAMIKGNTVTALFLLRNDLKDFREFEIDKKQLSSLYLLKTPEEISDVSGIHLNDPDFIDVFLGKLELKLLNQNINKPVQEPFEYLCRNSLCYELITCKYHKPNHLLQSPTKQLNLNGLRHECELDPFPTQVYQTLDDAIDELWDIKLTSDGLYIYALTRDRAFICWGLNSLTGYYERRWTSEEPIKDDINDWCLNEKTGTLVIGTTENAIKIISTENGDLRTTIQAAHDDSVNKIIIKSNGDEMISASVDCNIKIWDAKNLSKKDTIKTKRALSMAISKDQESLYVIYSNYKVIDKVSLVDRSIVEKVIVEKDCIVSSCISPDGKMLLLNTGRVSPELHLYRLSDYKLLNIYKGHIQPKFCIGVGFFNDFIFYSGSEHGSLVYWHVNQSEPISALKLHTLSLNAVASVYNSVLGREIVVTASDDYKVKILI